MTSKVQNNHFEINDLYFLLLNKEQITSRHEILLQHQHNCQKCSLRFEEFSVTHKEANTPLPEYILKRAVNTFHDQKANKSKNFVNYNLFKPAFFGAFVVIGLFFLSQNLWIKVKASNTLVINTVLKNEELRADKKEIIFASEKLNPTLKIRLATKSSIKIKKWQKNKVINVILDEPKGSSTYTIVTSRKSGTLKINLGHYIISSTWTLDSVKDGQLKLNTKKGGFFSSNKKVESDISFKLINKNSQYILYVFRGEIDILKSKSNKKVLTLNAGSKWTSSVSSKKHYLSVDKINIESQKIDEIEEKIEEKSDDLNDKIDMLQEQHENNIIEKEQFEDDDHDFPDM